MVEGVSIIVTVALDPRPPTLAVTIVSPGILPAVNTPSWFIEPRPDTSPQESSPIISTGLPVSSEAAALNATAEPASTTASYGNTPRFDISPEPGFFATSIM